MNVNPTESIETKGRRGGLRCSLCGKRSVHSFSTPSGVSFHPRGWNRMRVECAEASKGTDRP